MRSFSIIAAASAFVILLVCGSGPSSAAESPADVYAVGVARTDITPSYPVRLSGFGFRRTESEGVTQRIWAKALAVGTDDQGPAVLVTVDNLGVPALLVDDLAARLAKKSKVARSRLAVMATHTHTGPMLTGVAPTLFGEPIPKEHQERIHRYTAELTDKLEQVALAALADRQPSRLTWGIGTVGFAVNRRPPLTLPSPPRGGEGRVRGGGPVDHDLPVLVVRSPQNKVRAIYVSYACHCVTLSNNKISGDWAGYAQQQIEDAYPGAVALVSIGCGADSNPNSGVAGDKVEVAARQGAEIAAEVKRLLAGYLAPVTGPLTANRRAIELPLDALPTRAQWEERAARKGAVGYHARVQLARLDRGEALRTHISYPVQTWAFGDSLALVFLPGEVVVDYSRRLKRELDGRRLWINAYSNDAPAYIPSERVLKEGGYEGGGAMVYYDLPVPFRPGVEQRIVGTVHDLVGPRFRPPFDPQRTGGSPPLSPQQSRAAIHTKPNLAVDLVAAEPLVASPVAIDFGPDGRLWVAEMIDYPAGRRGDYQPGGRVRVLEDTRGTGIYDKATVFLENIPFPTGITVWRNGVLVCAAPDILYAEDTKRDGKADVVKKLFSGFGTHNYQARVNSLEYGLDGWVHGSCGMFGGTIRSLAGGTPVALGNRDFRCNPDTGAFEPATGRTQQGRVRDDWGNWFGCDNSNLCWHYPLADHYLRRNPHVLPPPAAVLVPREPDPNRLYPVRPSVQLFKLSGPPNRTTSACGLGIYRDDFLGGEYTGDTFTCEPVNLLVHRLKLAAHDSTFAGRRPDDEKTSEFLASTDNWFRPVQVRTGPDGCLWVVDMYRFVIEHPRWIPPEDLAKLDVRAGHDMGRLYRVRPADRAPRPVPRLDKLDTGGLVAALDSPNGWQRDMAGQMLLWRADPAAVPSLEDMVRQSMRPVVRLQALYVLGSLGRLQPALVRHALGDAHPGVRRHAVRLSEPFLAADADLGPALVKRVDDPDAQVRLQLAFSLGEWRDARAGRALAALALRHADDPYLSAAVLSSVHPRNVGEVLRSVLADAGAEPPAPLMERLLGVATALGDDKALPGILRDVTTPRQGRFARWQIAGLTGILDALDRRGQSLDKQTGTPALDRIKAMVAQARTTVAGEQAPEAERLAAVRLLGRLPNQRAADLVTLGKLLVPQSSPALQTAAVTALGRVPDDRVVVILTGGWKGHSPALQAQILDLLLNRDAWQRQLLHSLENGAIPPAALGAARRQRLLTHKDESVRARAAKLFAGATSADRQKVLQEYQAVASMTGNAARGKAVFARTCAACHRLRDVGHAVGPDLAALSNKSPAYLLTEILDPNKNVDSRYINYVAATRSGRTFTGILASESATSITLRGQEGKEQVLLRSELEQLQSTGKSLMPEGLEKDLSRQDLADLIAYLASP